MVAEFKIDSASYKNWLISQGGGDNHAELDRVKRMLPVILNECVTPVQKEYIIEYYVNQRNTVEIGEIYGVTKGTVSRTIHRGLNRIYKHLKYVSPSFASVNQTKRVFNKSKKGKHTLLDL